LMKLFEFLECKGTTTIKVGYWLKNLVKKDPIWTSVTKTISSIWICHSGHVLHD
jgi:hypothetical protein